MARITTFLSDETAADSRKRLGILESEWEAIIAIPGWEKSDKAREFIRRAIERKLPIFCPTSPSDEDFLVGIKDWAEF